MRSCMSSRRCFDDDTGRDTDRGKTNNKTVLDGSPIVGSPRGYPKDADRATYMPVEKAHEPQTRSAHHKVTREAFVAQQTSLAIVSGLVMAIAVSGFFAEVPAPPAGAGLFYTVLHDFRLMVWCTALFGALIATFCSVYVIVQAGLMDTDDQMNTFLAVFNNHWLGGENALNLLIVVPFVFMMLAIPQHMFLSHHEHQTNHTIFCLAMCLGLCPLPFGLLFLYLSRKAFHACVQPAPSTMSEADEAISDMMYKALQGYVERKGNFFAVQKKEFLQLFQKGEVERELAEMIFDDWKQKKLKSMIREEPGF